jgi:hypothetical protein
MVFFNNVPIALAEAALYESGHHFYITIRDGVVDVFLNDVAIGVIKNVSSPDGTDGTWINNPEIALNPVKLKSLVERSITRIKRKPILKLFFGTDGEVVAHQ